ncbi:MAG: hypothetical protein RLY31_431 [Bacteroidota bacterium]
MADLIGMPSLSANGDPYLIFCRCRWKEIHYKSMFAILIWRTPNYFKRDRTIDNKNQVFSALYSVLIVF